ncbi:MAG: DUF1566 domain-containing protein [Candidatus Omnitrophica bacterium]|nr:DUF1566 domain-containing protein [Candidatus Omnitrophota bacterium]
MNQTGKFRLPDSGCTRCFNEKGREINPKPEDKLYGQNGCFIVNPISFTKLSLKSNPLPDDFSWKEGLRMVKDNNTGLIWEVKSPNPKDINFCKVKYNFSQAQETFIKKLNQEKYGGFSDWRLPNKDELRSIVDYGKTDPAVDESYFPNCQVSFYWTSIPYKMQPPFIWGIFFGLGSGIPYTPSSLQCVRAVRGGLLNFGNPEKPKFKDGGDGTITDLKTDLMWQKGENPRMSWYEALDYCKQLKLAGHSDWRLPNIKELNTILDLSYKDGWWYHKDFFPAEGLQPPLLHYFSSTPFEKTYAWVTNFCFGYDGYYANKNAKLLIRAVRNLTPAIRTGSTEFKLPDSGQKICYDQDGNQITPPKKKEDYYGQDGSYSINPFSFRKLGYGGKEISDELSFEKGFLMTKDGNTGLVWEIKSPNPADINFKDNKYTFEAAKEYVDQLNKREYAGFNDWRLPNREEFRSIIDYSSLVPAVSEKYFPHCRPSFYWTSLAFAKNPDLIWGVYFAYGCTICYLKDTSYYVRAVRGGYNKNFGDPQKYAFKDNTDGTITDLNTNLVWKKEESPDLNWQEALKYCENLTLGGHSDWRLPNIKEIATLIDLSCTDGLWYNKEFFPDVKTAPLGFYWASTTYGDTFGWGVNFQFGYDGYYAAKKNGRYAFRPVRNA